MSCPAQQLSISDARGLPPLALIVDDSPFLVLHLARQLAALGWRTQLTEGADDLAAMAASADFVFVELQRFQANCFQLTRALAAYCACPLVLLSGSGRGTDLQWGLRAGARAVLTRPVSVSALRTTLQVPDSGNEGGNGAST